MLCATDTVAALTIVKEKEYPQLNSILFGEGIVNDAVSILIFTTVQNVFGKKHEEEIEMRYLHDDESGGYQQEIDIKWADIGLALLHFVYLSVVSIAIGLLFGALSALITKKLTHFKEHPAREITLLFVLAYLSYLISETLALSGIITLFCCGFTMNHYTYYNMSE